MTEFYDILFLLIAVCAVVGAFGVAALIDAICYGYHVLRERFRRDE